MSSQSRGTAHLWLRNNVLGLVAIFIALSGTAIATNVASEPDQAAKAAKGKRGPRGPAGPAGAQGPQGLQGPAGSADTGAQILAKLLPVDGAGTGLDADLLDGLSSAAFLGSTAVAGGDLAGNYPNPTLKAPEAWHVVGAMGQPAFQGAWVNVDPSGPTAAFYRDPFGIVHLKGLIEDGGNGTTAFTLPAGYRPAFTSNFPSVSYASPVSVANILISALGAVNPFAANASTADGITLDGITFRACGAPGAEACPP